MHALLLSLLLGAVSNTNAPADAQSGLLTRTVSVGNRSYTYQVYVPSSLRGKQHVPVILFLHGIGQRGEGGFVPGQGAAAAFARQYLERVPAVVLLPQCGRGRYWHDAEMERMVMAELEQTAREFGADEKRLYLTGVSMGGFGAWHIAAAHPSKFAAVVTICGGSPLKSGDRFAPIAKKVAATPVWVFHGSDDAVVPVTESRQMVEALKHVEGNRVRYSEYKGVGHSVWLNALAERDLMPWLLAQHRD
ncbi:MAG TPA: alpha/beta hydrolase-fold protein [Pyrinomonadaceae bacterium]|jgi:predicted peptidase